MHVPRRSPGGTNQLSPSCGIRCRMNVCILRVAARVALLVHFIPGKRQASLSEGTPYTIPAHRSGLQGRVPEGPMNCFPYRVSRWMSRWMSRNEHLVCRRRSFISDESMARFRPRSFHDEHFGSSAHAGNGRCLQGEMCTEALHITA